MAIKGIVLFLVFMCIGFSLRTQVKQAGDLVEVSWTSPQNGAQESVDVSVGDRVTFTLDENPTTGYQWMIPEEIEGYNAIWTLESSEYNGPNSNLDGAGGSRTFVLAVNQPGTEILTLAYGRPWLYDTVMDSYQSTGYFDPSLMQGWAMQLQINAS
ncbi:unnamed protein product [Moneuplotes crassus]|uniref:Proteinase inhibitor I42 chagasin domain-containing protein n=2 Tax=Euplotes crassus TaxID=5936 RepID=A0AAD1Y2M9_EUPCR|nr:unnamed protein product [Moneuplotes crassus]